MNIVYAISTGGCRDGIWLDYTITDLANVGKLVELYFHNGMFNFECEYIGYELTSDNKKIIIFFEMFGCREEVTLELIELTSILN